MTDYLWGQWRASTASPSFPLLALIGCTLLCYGFSLHDSFQFDDFETIVKPAEVHSLAAWFAVMGHGLRPLLKLTYVLNWVSGCGIAGFHLVNIALHLGNILLVACIGSLALRDKEVTKGGPIRLTVFLAATLFALHPVQTEAVTYISGRSMSLMTMAYLGSLACYAAGIRNRRPLLWAVACPVLYLVALLTRESAIMLPAGLLLWEFCIEKPAAGTMVRRQAIPWLLFIVFGCAVVAHPGYFNLLYSISGSRPMLSSLMYQTHGTGYLLSRLILVNRLSIDPGLGFSVPGIMAVAFEAAVIVTMAIAAVFVRKKMPLVAFGVFWFFLHTYFPYLFLPRLDVLNEHHMYLANAGLFCAIAALPAALPLHRWSVDLRYPVLAALIPACMVFTILRNNDYRTELSLWKQTVAVSPANPRVHNNLGIVYKKEFLLEPALREFKLAVELEPEYDDARANLQRLERSALILPAGGAEGK